MHYLYKKHTEKFAYMKNMYYLCTEILKTINL